MLSQLLLCCFFCCTPLMHRLVHQLQSKPYFCERAMCTDSSESYHGSVPCEFCCWKQNCSTEDINVVIEYVSNTTIICRVPGKNFRKASMWNSLATATPVPFYSILVVFRSLHCFCFFFCVPCLAVQCPVTLYGIPCNSTVCLIAGCFQRRCK